MKELIKHIEEYVTLYRDTKTGIAWVENGKAGTGHSAHPNIHITGSVRGMKERGFWGRNDRTIRSHGFIYNIDACGATDEYGEIAREHCKCGGVH